MQKKSTLTINNKNAYSNPWNRSLPILFYIVLTCLRFYRIGSCLVKDIKVKKNVALSKYFFILTQDYFPTNTIKRDWMANRIKSMFAVANTWLWFLWMLKMRLIKYLICKLEALKKEWKRESESSERENGCVCVCVWERERQRDRERENKSESV
jgi:hypothetical protein